MKHREDFRKLREFFDEMNSSNSTNHKIAVLTRYKNEDFVKRVLFYTYNPYFNFGVTSTNLKKRQDLIAPLCIYDDLFCLLDDLNERRITGHSAIEATNRFVADCQEYSDLVYQVIDRNLETRATVSLINRVNPGFIPTFEVALAYDAAKVKGVDLLDSSWYVSRKLDGVRCICIVRGESIRFLSRNGKEFHTLSRVADEIKRLGITDVVLDGEICLHKEDGSDDFQGILKEIQKKDHTIQNPKYWIFDILAPEEFEGSLESPVFSTRIDARRHRLGDCERTGILEVLPQVHVLGEGSLDEMKAQSKDFDWEGLIAKRDVPYSSGRSKNMLKIKEFFDAEYEVTGIVTGPQRVIIEGREIEEEMLSAITIEHNGSQVQVGSGFTLDERRYYHQNPEEMMGKTIKVQYFETTVDQHGNSSLRFPVFKGVYGESREV